MAFQQFAELLPACLPSWWLRIPLRVAVGQRAVVPVEHMIRWTGEIITPEARIFRSCRGGSQQALGAQLQRGPQRRGSADLEPERQPRQFAGEPVEVVGLAAQQHAVARSARTRRCLRTGRCARCARSVCSSTSMACARGSVAIAPARWASASKPGGRPKLAGTAARRARGRAGTNAAPCAGGTGRPRTSVRRDSRGRRDRSRARCRRRPAAR